MNKIEFILDEVMDRKGISINRLSKLSGVSRTHISHLRAGKCTNPTILVIANLASALGVKTDDLLKY